MTELERLLEARRLQGLRVANASRSHREREMEVYRRLEALVEKEREWLSLDTSTGSSTAAT